MVKGQEVDPSNLGEHANHEGAVGPGSYQYGFEDNHHVRAPQYTMRAKTSDIYPQNPNPGPGTYEPKASGLRGPQYSLRPKVYQPDGLNPAGVPGPGTYDPAFKEKGGPKYTLRPKTTAGDGHKLVPGPGAYDPDIKPVAHKNPSWSVGREERGKLAGDALAPGPGAYDLKSQLKGVGTTFTKDERIKGQGGMRDTPGPGEYKLETTVEEAMRTSKGKTFGVKVDLKNSVQSPSPGDYDQDVGPVRPKPAKYGFGTGTREHGHSANLTPAPGSYDVKVDFVKYAGARWGMGSAEQRREDITSSKLNPGPGAYDPGLFNDSR